jgi:hypothetical protein
MRFFSVQKLTSDNGCKGTTIAYYFPAGTKYFFSNTLATAKTVTAVTSAAPAVASSTAHGLVDADPVLFNSGWQDAASTVFEVDQLTVDTFGITGLDATDNSVYAPGSGGGTVQKISTWVEIPQILTASTNGGGIKYGTIDPLGSRQATKQPIGFEAIGVDIKMGYDPSNATIQAMQALTRTSKKVALKLVLPGGGRVYGYGNIACSEFPEIGSKDSPLQLSVGIGFDGRAISYGA